MKTIIRLGLPLLAAPFLAVAQLWAQTTPVHPGFTLTSLRPSGFNPMVSGIDFLSDGRMVLTTWDGFGKGRSEVYLISGVTSGDASKVTYKTFYKGTGLNEVLGVKVVDDKIYVLQKDGLSYLPDADKNDSADNIVKVGTGFVIESNKQNLEFALGMVYKDSAFYAGLATNWTLDAKQTNERGCVVKIPIKGGNWETFACGMRTPNGLVLGPDGAIFTTENQGNWVPTSKLLHLFQGHFYWVHKSNPGPGPFDKEPETPPAIWMDNGTISISPTQPVYMTSGPFKGQMVAGDNNMGTLQRYFLEKVADEWQGAIFHFSGGLEAGANRIMAGPDGAFYVGGLGTQEWTGWDWNGKDYGLQRLAPNGKAFFDMFAVRSLGQNKMEIEFTEPAGDAAGVAANYKVQQWFYKPVLDYGAGKQPVQTLTVSKATLSADKKKVTLDISGMLVKNVVYFKLSNITSSTNETLVGTEAWYTQNAFGPGTDPVVSPTDLRGSARALSGPLFTARSAAGGRWSIWVSEPGTFSVEMLDLNGRVLETRQGQGPSEIVTRGAYSSGLFLARVRGAQGIAASRILYDGR